MLRNYRTEREYEALPGEPEMLWFAGVHNDRPFLIEWEYKSSRNCKTARMYCNPELQGEEFESLLPTSYYCDRRPQGEGCRTREIALTEFHGILCDRRVIEQDKLNVATVAVTKFRAFVDKNLC